MKLISKLRGAVLTLLTGTAFSQLVMVSASPFLTRLYAPSVFGEYATLSMVLSLVVVFATGKYELAVFLQTEHEKAWHAACLAMTTAVLSATTLLVLSWGIVLMMPSKLAEHFFFQDVDLFALIGTCYLLVILNASQSALFALMNRNGQFSGISIARVSQAVSMVGAQILFGIWDKGLFGLLCGTLAGLLACAFVQFSYAVRNNGQVFPDRRLMGEIARANKNLPLHTIPTDLIGSLLAQFPVYFLGANFSSAAVGYFSLAQRTLQAPMQLIANSIGDVFRQRASSMYAERGECRQYFLKIAGLLALLALFGCIVTVVWAVPLFSLVFGKQWETAGSFAAIMIFMFALKFIVNPISFMFLIVKRTGLDLGLHLAFLCILVLTFYQLNPKDVSVEDALWLFVSIYSAMYVVYFLISYRFSKGFN
jgi:O-antigen/teichoic acid export membrane protein